MWAAMELGDGAPPPAGVSPRDYFVERRRAGDLEFASAFLAHALGRFEAVAWAARFLDERADGLPPLDRQALDHALRWLGEPTEAHRVAAGDAADAAGARSAERLLAAAAFMSGGSIAPPDLPPVHPAPELCGRLAGAAVAIAAHRDTDRAAAFGRALDLGEAVASGGVDALAAETRALPTQGGPTQDGPTRTGPTRAGDA